MEVEEPSDKVVLTRGPKESKTVDDDVKKEEKNENGEKPTVQEDKVKDDNGEKKETRVSYSRDELLELKESPASKLWPAFADEDCVRNPEIWRHTPSGAKRCVSPLEDIKRQIIIEDGIVLSPQRQSFGQGCHVPQSAPERGLQQERTKSMMSRTIERDTRDGRNRLTGRVGRGSRPLDYRTTNLRTDGRNRNGERQTSPWDRNDKELKRSRDDDGYNYKRGRKHNDDEDPEWMTYGPTSISETIELRGFNKETFKDQKRDKRGSFTGSDGIPVSTKDKEEKNEQQNKKKTPSKDGQQNKDDDDADFDINQFFTSDSFLQFADEPEQSNSNESRFRQFFGIGGRQGSQSGSRRSSGAEELLEYSGVSSRSPSTPHTPSPSQKFMFTPIQPVEANTEPSSLSEMLQKTKLDVKPLLDTILSSGKKDEMRVKGLKRLEEIEPAEDKNKKENKGMVSSEEGKKEENVGGDMTAFFKFVENMKTSGNLPAKPQPVIPGLPSHLLPRPPSPKTKTPRRSPSPLANLDRSTSPVEFLHRIIQKQQSPSPPQVVPQMNRPYSPLETPLYKPVEMLRRSPSPLQSMYEQKRFSPLMTPEAFMSPSPGYPSHIHNRPSPMMYHMADKPRFELPNETPKPAYQNHKQTPRSNNIAKPKVTPKTQSAALKDLGFMPTSVLQKIKKDQMTPKSKADGDEKEAINFEDLKTKLNGISKEECVSSPGPKKGLLASKEEPLLKPTAFKPYQGVSPHSVSPLRSGIHSAPQSPQVAPGTPHHKEPLPCSAPVTPQRHPHAEQILINLQAHAKQAASERSIRLQKALESTQPNKQSSQPIMAPTSIENINNHRRDDSPHHGNDMVSQHAKRDFERPMPPPHNIHHHQQQHQQQLQQQQQQHLQQQQQLQQQQIRRENLQYLANMARLRQTPPPLSMMSGHVSPQSILGSPAMHRSPFPVHQGKPHMHHPGAIPSQPLHPGNFRMAPPTRTSSGMPPQSPASLMQMMPPQRHPMMYRHGHAQMPSHPGFHPMMSPRGNYPMPRQHPGYMHPRHKVPNAPMPGRQSPNHDNALSKWFSDDVLQSSAPNIPVETSSKKMLSVEDLERQQALCTT